MEVLRNISVIWSLLHVLILFAFLFESRYSRKKTLVLTFACMGPLLILNIFLYILLGPERTAQILLLSCTIPSFIFFYILAKQRDGRFFFTFCLADTVSYEIITITMLIDYYLAGDKFIFMLISRIIIFPVIELLVWKYLRHPYLELQQTVKRGWLSFAGLSIVFYVLLIIMTSVPTIITSRPDDLPALILVLIIMPFMYLIVFQVLARQQKLFQAEEESRILRVQASMLAQRTEHIREVEEQTRIKRHDMRHKLRTAAELVGNGRTAEAIEFLTKEEQSLEQSTDEHWCSHPVLDAVFSVYFRQAKAAGIHVDASWSIPDKLSVDIVELSTVFANALENSIQACKELPESERWIRCKCLSSPQFMFQIKNPYVGTVSFDRKGHPISTKPGHGIGIRSIAAFCEKNGAHCEYKADNGVFSVRMLIL